MNQFWLEVIGVTVIAGVAALLAGLLLEPIWALGIVAAVYLLFAMHHLRQLSRLMNWLAQPLGTLLPAGGGAWEVVFAALHRRARVAAEERRQLSLALNRLLRAGQALPDGVVILDTNFIIEWLNPMAEGHLGLSSAMDIGSPITNLLREPGFIEYIAAAQFAEPLALHPLRNPGHTLALQIVPYGAQKLLLTRDITHQIKLETMRRDFVANVSHELKTPLTVVSGFLETSLDSLRESSVEEVARFLTLASEQALRMQRLVEDLLALSALETGSPPPSEERVGLDELLAEVAAEARALSNGHHQIEVASTTGISLLGSRSELRSALSNLVSNAVRYTPEGGKVRIAWEPTADGGGKISVSDNGIGIESQHIPRLTERFYRIDRGRSRESGGTGLGLAIVKHVLTRHQAVLEISSQLGGGSTFSACFPSHRIVETQGQRLGGNRQVDQGMTHEFPA
ncbi:MAG: phosphate regulon sensor histidine kinase PhoR [Sterolibacterium sp.]|nr:phosphate regulon sensor histidine kinase PhoR [Sterolibacterium sp.]